MRNLVKAEILWSRKCPLSCHYCNMVQDKDNIVPIELWEEGFENLRALDVGFCAFYGAEPLMEFKNLPEIIKYCEDIGILTTIITSGIVKNFHDKLKELYNNDLRSLSMSYDMVPLGSSSEAKGYQAIKGIEYFNTLGPNRDTAFISTLTRTNYTKVIETVKHLQNKYGSWFFFDIIHPDRGQDGSKCKGSSDELLFKETDLPGLHVMLTELIKMKDNGFNCHSSKGFVDLLLNNDYELLKEYNWNCADDLNLFPSWVTVDCDGIVYPCDDFQPQFNKKFYVWNLYEEWEEFKEFWRPVVKAVCPGCAWNTHIDAHLIKGESLPFSDYVHTKE